MLKTKLENYVLKYETSDFIKDDPIQFPHRFNTQEDIEIAGFLASIFAYGKREVFIEKLNQLFNIMENKPYYFIKNFYNIKPDITKINYRFSKSIDIYEILRILSDLYEKHSLKELFKSGYTEYENADSKLCKIHFVFSYVADYFYSKVSKNATVGFYHMLPNAKNFGACKRLNMFLRWMVRTGPVDFGIWNFIDRSELLIPLDVHVGRISRELGLLDRKSNDYKSVVQLTDNLKLLDPFDPIKYDFALFGFGVNS